jgi:hypothetical protein
MYLPELSCGQSAVTMRLDTWFTADKFAPLFGLCTARGTRND